MVKNRIAYCTVLLIAFSFVGLHENKITYTALYAVLLLPILCVIYMLISGKKLSISERISSQTVKKGDTSQYFLTVKNNSPFPYPMLKAVFQSGHHGYLQKGKRKEKNILTVISEPKECFFSLSPHESKEVIFDISGQFRGTFSVGIRKIYLYDPLGLIHFTHKVTGDIRLTVMPNAVEIPFLQVSSYSQSGSGKSQSASFDEDYTSVEQLKQYTPSDGYKKIHWKLSAKKNELISKEYKSVSAKSAVMIVYNTVFSGKRTAFEKMLCEDRLTEAAVSVISYCEKHLIDISLHYLCGGLTASSELPEDLYTAVSNISFCESVEFDRFVFGIKKLDSRECGDNIFIFTHNVNDVFCSTVKALCLSDNNVVIFCYLYENTTNLNKIKELQAAGAICCILSEKINIADAVSDEKLI